MEIKIFEKKTNYNPSSQQGAAQPTHLIEDGLVGADEAPLEHLLLPVRVRHRVADVEQLGKENYIFTFKIVVFISM